MRLLMDFLKREEGATVVEYALIASLISIAAIASMTALGTSLSSMFNTVAASFSR